MTHLMRLASGLLLVPLAAAYGPLTPLARPPHAVASAPARHASYAPRMTMSPQTTPQTLVRQSEILEVLTAANDEALVDLNDAKAAYDIVSLGLVRAVGIDPSDVVTIGLELPADAVSAGAGDRLAQRCGELLRAQVESTAALELRLAGL